MSDVEVFKALERIEKKIDKHITILKYIKIIVWGGYAYTTTVLMIALSFIK